MPGIGNHPLGCRVRWCVSAWIDISKSGVDCWWMVDDSYLLLTPSKSPDALAVFLVCGPAAPGPKVEPDCITVLTVVSTAVMMVSFR